MAADGAIPLLHRAYDGGAGEVAQVVDTMNRLKTLAGPRSFLLVGDSKLISYTNVTAMIRNGTTCSVVNTVQWTPRRLSVSALARGRHGTEATSGSAPSVGYPAAVGTPAASIGPYPPAIGLRITTRSASTGRSRTCVASPGPSLTTPM